ncbi:MAG: 50S ribosomal protein L25 [Candidatus Omnitrophica bacterium]|nr:50S ribosomal protein L25 [Candidatus Omnitrophota bacterium]
MEEIKLTVQVREEVGTRKIKSIRRGDLVPAVIYGGKQETTLVKFERKTYERIRRGHHGEMLVHLDVMKGDKKLKDLSVIVEEEQHDPVTEKVVHVDFRWISLTEKIQVKVPVSAKGDAIGVKQEGGNLDHLLWELEVECLPTQIPEEISVDVSALKIGDSVHVKDIVLPSGVIAKSDADVIVFSVSAPQELEAAATPEAGEKVEPEVIGKKKAVEEGEEGAAPAAKGKSEESGDKKEKK